MILIPSLEILDGKLVRLIGGIDSEPVVLDPDPLRAARKMLRDGAEFVHVVDLDAVFQRGNNNSVLAELAANQIPFQVRGGIATVARAKQLLDLGADRIVLGSLPITHSEQARLLVDSFGPRIAATLDVRDGEVRVRDGRVETGIDLEVALPLMRSSGVRHLIFNSEEHAGEDAALDHRMVRRVLAENRYELYVRCTLQADGELQPLYALERHGLRGVVINHALCRRSLPFYRVMQRA